MKEQRKGCLPALVYTVLILGLFLGFICLSQCDQEPPEEAFTTNSEPGTAVYADIISIVPKQALTSPGGGYGAILCQAETIDNQTIWVYISVDNYARFIDPYGSADSPPVRYDPAVRFHGTVISTENIAQGLSAATGTVLMDFTHLE